MTKHFNGAGFERERLLFVPVLTFP